jgi:choline transport protein
MLVLSNPDLVIKPWMAVVGFQVTNLFIFSFNCFSRILPFMSQCVLTMSLCEIIIIFVSVLAVSPTYQPASFVFATFVNKSGWGNGAIAVFTGAVGVNWGFSCLDALTHLAEEIPNPKKNVPKVLLGTVIVGMSTTFPITLAILFCIQDIDAIISTPTYVASLEFFNQAFSGNHSAAIGLESLVLISTCGSLWGCHAWQARLAWSLARDRGLPLYTWIGHIAPPPFGVPLAAHTWSCFWVGVLGCLYLYVYQWAKG